MPRRKGIPGKPQPVDRKQPPPPFKFSEDDARFLRRFMDDASFVREIELAVNEFLKELNSLLPGDVRATLDDLMEDVRKLRTKLEAAEKDRQVRQFVEYVLAEATLGTATADESMYGADTMKGLYHGPLRRLEAALKAARTNSPSGRGRPSSMVKVRLGFRVGVALDKYGINLSRRKGSMWDRVFRKALEAAGSPRVSAKGTGQARH